MPMIDGNCSSRAGLPHLHGLIITGRGNIFAVRRPGEGSYKISMAAIGGDQVTIVGIPDLDNIAVATIEGGRHKLPIRGPRRCPRRATTAERVIHTRR